MNNSEEKLEQIKQWVQKNYKKNVAEYTVERSVGNFDDCFNDGYECGIACSAYEVGKILGMELEEFSVKEFEIW